MKYLRTRYGYEFREGGSTVLSYVDLAVSDARAAELVTAAAASGVVLEVFTYPRPPDAEAPVTPSLVIRAEAAQAGAEAAAQAAAASAESVQREQPGGVAGLDSAGKLFEDRLPDRLDEEAIVQLVADEAGGVVAREQPGGVAGLDGAGKLFEARIPDRLAATELALPSNAQRDTRFGDPQHEDEAIYTYPNRLNFGEVEPPPPVVIVPASRNVDLIAHWYNDFGLEYVASSSNSANGWHGWYDWRWNFPTNTGDGESTLGYDPQRHPLQGFYDGDDPNVLGWQCKWMAEAGLTAVSLTASDGFDTATWSNPADGYHWMYQLFTNVPNFKALKYVLWLKHASNASYNAAYVPGDGQHPVEQQWAKMVTLFRDNPGGYVWQEHGKNYPVLFCWDGEALRGAWDNYNGSTKMQAALVWLSNQFKAIGYDGVMVCCRQPTADSVMPRGPLYHQGVIFAEGDYSGTGTTGGLVDYADYAARASWATGYDQIPAVQISYKSVHPHPSEFNLPGSTPALFRKALSRAIRALVRNRQRRMLFLNNVSEWAESGPGLIPNVADGFGYLDAIRTLPVEPTAQPNGGLVQRIVTAGNQGSITANIPTWARRCEIRLYGSSNVEQPVRMRLGGDSGANYNQQVTLHSGTSVTTAATLDATWFDIGIVGAASAFRSMCRAEFDCFDSGAQRAVLADGTLFANAAAGNLKRTTMSGGHEVATRPTSVSVHCSGGYFNTGAVLELYCWG